MLDVVICGDRARSTLKGWKQCHHYSFTEGPLLHKIIRVPSHVIILRNGCHRQRWCHLHARLLVSDPEYLLHRLLALRLYVKGQKCKRDWIATE